MSRRPFLVRVGGVAGVLSLGLSLARADDGTLPGPVELDGPATVEGLRLADADGDGIPDVMVVSGRKVLVWKGRKTGISKAPTWTYLVPEAATCAWPDPTPRESADGAPNLLVLAEREALRVPVSGEPQPVAGLAVDLGWRDARRAILSEIVHDGSLVLPSRRGFDWVPGFAKGARKAIPLPVAPERRVAPSGTFVDDTALVTSSWPMPFFVPATAKAPEAVYIVGTDAFQRFQLESGALVAKSFPIGFLPRAGDTRFVPVDLDGDGTPDLAHEATTNDSGAYTFFRTPRPGEVTDDLRPPRGAIRLRGFQIQPDYTDLDGDGRPDFVVTTIDIDGTNVMRAVMKGRVVAKTRAFLNRSLGGGGEIFPSSPDTEVESEIGVKIMFTFSGAIEVRRSYTILSTADVDGDGRRDLVIRTGPSTLSVHKGTAEGIWAKGTTEISIPAVGKSPDVEGYVADLTGDKKDDFVLLYKAPPGGVDRTVVLISP